LCAASPLLTPAVTAYAGLVAVPAVPASALAALRLAVPPGGTGTAPASPLLGVNRIVDYLMAPLKVDGAIVGNRNHSLTQSRVVGLVLAAWTVFRLYDDYQNGQPDGRVDHLGHHSATSLHFWNFILGHRRPFRRCCSCINCAAWITWREVS
jgi:hypothetical protein